MWIHLDGLAQLGNGIIIAPRRDEPAAEIGIDNQGERIELLRPFELGDRPIEFAKRQRRPTSIPMVCSGVIRI